MSYSRWNHSRWYTYADTSGGFTVSDASGWATIHFSNDQIVKIIAGDWTGSEKPEDVTDGQLAELVGYMKEYAADERLTDGNSN